MQAATAHRVQRSQLGAAILAIALIALGGVSYRVLADRLNRVGQYLPLPKGSLSRVPAEIGGWIGIDVPLENAVIRRTDTDEHLNRLYRNASLGRELSIFVGYGARARDLWPHRPEVCYPGAGWTLRTSSLVEIAAEPGRVFPAKLHEFGRGGLDDRRILVLNYYVVDGVYAADPDVVREKVSQGASGVRYLAQVQLACAADLGDTRGSEEALRTFAGISAAPIRALLPELGDAPIGAGRGAAR
ncbi:MAG: exosortase-associated EpsI family protein [Phycisphaerae bacterium]